MKKSRQDLCAIVVVLKSNFELFGNGLFKSIFGYEFSMLRLRMMMIEGVMGNKKFALHLLHYLPLPLPKILLLLLPLQFATMMTWNILDFSGCQMAVFRWASKASRSLTLRTLNGSRVAPVGEVGEVT